MALKLEVGDLVVYNPSGSMKFRTPADCDDDESHTGIVLKKVKYRDDRKTNYEVLWDDCHTIYGYYREELRVVGRARPQ